MSRQKLAIAATVLAIVGSAVAARAACDASICGTSPCTITGTHDVDAGCTLDFAGKDVTLAQNAVLQNLTGFGAFMIEARSLILRGTIRFPNGGVRITVAGDLSMPTATSVIDTSASTPDSSGTVEIYAGGTVTVNRILTSGAGYGGDIQLYGRNVLVPGTLQATADGLGGDVWIDADQDITIAGTVNVSATGATVGNGGRIGVEPSGKLHTMPSAALRAIGVNGGNGGEIWALAPDTMTLDGVIVADGTGPEGFGGDVWFDGSAITTSADFSANGGSGPGASGGIVALSASNGTLVASNTSSMSVVSAAGAGEIWLESLGDMTVAGDLNATASGTDSYGGRIGLWAYGPSSVVVGATASFDVTSSAATGIDGQIQLGGCNVTVSGQLKANAHADGQNVVQYRGAFTVTSSGRMLAGATGQNLLQCRCQGGDPNALPFPGTCPTTPTCAVPPVTQGSPVVTPPFAPAPIPLHPCACFDKVRNGTETGIDCGGGTCPRCVDGQPCDGDADCVSGKCDLATQTCKTACDDGVKNGDESDVDCGGQCPPGCPVGKACRWDFDCADKNCDSQNTWLCEAPTCTDRHRNGAETDKNCGGGTCPTCAHGKRCAVHADCTSKVCDPTPFVCLPPTCTDRTENDVETDEDCGGGTCEACGDGFKCKVDTDCKSQVCNQGTRRCDAPKCTDGKLNGTETDLECGGATCDPCADGKICKVDSDCTSKVCDPTAVPGVSRCMAPTCQDRATNGAETGPNCGGGTCAPCPNGEPCKVDTDCLMQVCDATTHTCQEPSCTDARQNEQETDVDCGGPECGDCDDTRKCKVGDDCKSKVCNLKTDPTQLRCAVPSCTPPDGAANGAETGKDCGGGVCPKCPTDEGCQKGPRDCLSGVCGILWWTCRFNPDVPVACWGACRDPSCTDAVQNGGETDVGCGGPTTCRRCNANEKCLHAGDCAHGLVCDDASKTCRKSCPDGVPNGAETGVDCGGGQCPACTLGQGCAGPDDCASKACGADGKCKCPDRTFTFEITSSDGGPLSGAAWPGGQLEQSAPGGCSVRINAPHYRIDLVCGVVAPDGNTADSFTIDHHTGYSSCSGRLGAVSCNTLGGGPSSCGDRPSCSVALNGNATAEFVVDCVQ